MRTRHPNTKTAPAPCGVICRNGITGRRSKLPPVGASNG